MSNVLDFLISMVIVFMTFSVMVSGATEAWNTLRSKRGRFLWKGIRRLIGATPEAEILLAKLRLHPAIRALTSDDKPKSYPSYIPGTVFAAALTDVVLAHNAGARLEKYGLPEAVALLPADLPLKQVLQTTWRRAQGDAAHFEIELARFFDDCMDRVSGWYKRDAQAHSLWLGLLLAVVLNVDAVHIAVALWQDPQISRDVASQGAQIAAKYAAASPQSSQLPVSSASTPLVVSPLSGGNISPDNALPIQLPVGWPARWYTELPVTPARGQLEWHVCAAILGFLLMAGSCLVGVPMWYQLLTTLLPLRAAGRVPKRTPPRAASAEPSGPPAQISKPGDATGTPSPSKDIGVNKTWLNELERVVVDQGAVEEVQRALNVPETGSLDASTRAAIKAVQVKARYAPTGQLTRLLLQDLGFVDRF